MKKILATTMALLMFATCAFAITVTMDSTPGPVSGTTGTFQGTTSDGSTNVTTWKDSDGNTVGSVDTDGIATLNGVATGQPVAVTGNQLVYHGDSLIQGSPYETSWTDDVVPSATMVVTELGVGGQTIAQMMEITGYGTVDPLYASRAPWNIVYIMGGTNDIASGASAVETYSVLKALCQARKKVGWKVVISTIPDQIDKTAVVESYNSLIRKNWWRIADAISDPHSNVNLQDSSNETYFQADGVHLTTAGYSIITAVAQQSINSVIAGGPFIYDITLPAISVPAGDVTCEYTVGTILIGGRVMLLEGGGGPASFSANAGLRVGFYSNVLSTLGGFDAGYQDVSTCVYTQYDSIASIAAGGRWLVIGRYNTTGGALSIGGSVKIAIIP